jgi:hypothetical protein
MPVVTLPPPLLALSVGGLNLLPQVPSCEVCGPCCSFFARTPQTRAREQAEGAEPDFESDTIVDQLQARRGLGQGQALLLARVLVLVLALLGCGPAGPRQAKQPCKPSNAREPFPRPLLVVLLQRHRRPRQCRFRRAPGL